MLKYCLTILSIFLSCGMFAAEVLVPDSLYCFDPGKPLYEAIYHLRLVPDRYSPVNTSLYWNYMGPDEYSRADFAIPALVDVDNTDTMDIRCRIYRRTPQGERLVNETVETVPFSRGRAAAFSVVLRANSAGSRLCFGDRHESEGVIVDYSPMQRGALAFMVDRRTELVNHSLISLSRPEHLVYGGPIKIDSANLLAGIWSYLDRESDPAKVAGGMDYSVAIVPESDGSYTIVYQGRDSGLWKQGDVKGRLYPTPFAWHYDLEWYDSTGYLHKEDTSADLILEGHVLRLNFPLLSTTLRLRKR